TALTQRSRRSRRQQAVFFKKSKLSALYPVAAAVALIAAVAAFGAGGSTSPEGDGESIAEGANVRRQSRGLSQRVEDNAFHQKIAPWVMEHTADGHQAVLQRFNASTCRFANSL